ncbi:class I SAM-dependent methyltransferase [Gloeobacter morelensis]|nr:class I SAM-dependent methyltransferase [Gloeobacter morelensis]
MLERVLEAEVMDSQAEAEAYDAMDHGEVNARFVADMLALGPADGPWLDLGTGPAHLPVLLAGERPHIRITAVDLAASMLAIARRRVEAARLMGRITLVRGDAKAPALGAARFACVFSNSLVHHLPQPAPFWQACARLLAPGGVLFVRDLARPGSLQRRDALVERYAAGCDDDQRRLFAESLQAAFTPPEVALQARAAGLAGAQVAMSSDRHWTLVYRLAV